MIRQPAPDICRNWRERKLRLLIPGGWLMNIPAYRIEGDFEDAYIDWYCRLGLSFAKASEKVRHTVQEHAAAGFRASLFASVTYYAKMYSRMYPERLRPAGSRNIFTPVGYDPATMQTVHVPGYRPSGRQPLAKKLLLEMGHGA